MGGSRVGATAHPASALEQEEHRTPGTTKGYFFRPCAYMALVALDGLQQKALRIRSKIAFCVVKLNDAKSGRRPLTTPQAGRVGRGLADSLKPLAGARRGHHVYAARVELAETARAIIIVDMVVFVCSPQASATTGAALRVDGGVVRSIA